MIEVGVFAAHFLSPIVAPRGPNRALMPKWPQPSNGALALGHWRDQSCPNNRYGHASLAKPLAQFINSYFLIFCTLVQTVTPFEHIQSNGHNC